MDSNGSSCDDINECHELNGGCEFGCRNSIGSFQCYCYHGYELKNETHCDTEIQCDILQIDAYQGNYFTCREGFNLTINNLTYNDCIDFAMIQNTENLPTATTATCSCSSTTEPIQSSTIIMVTVLIFIILVQTVIIILVLLCSCAMRRTAKNPKEQQNIRQAQFHENNLAIPLEDIIEKQPYATPDTMEKIQGNSEITSIPKCENIY